MFRPSPSHDEPRYTAGLFITCKHYHIGEPRESLFLTRSEGFLLFRHAGSHGRSFWATPGGGLEDGETFEQAACREASEELGVNGMSLRLLWEATNDFVHVDHAVGQQERYS